MASLWGFTHLSSMSYEKLQAHAWAYSYIPFAEKYYKNDPEAKRRLFFAAFNVLQYRTPKRDN